LLSFEGNNKAIFAAFLNCISKFFDFFKQLAARYWADANSSEDSFGYDYWRDFLVDGELVTNPFDVEMLPPGFYRLHVL